MSTNLNFHQTYLVEEFAEAYNERRMSRRDMMRRVLAVSGSVPLTASVLLSLGCGTSSEPSTPAATATSAPPPTAAAVVGTPVGPGVSATDAAIRVADVRYPGPAGEVLGYVARPSKDGQFPAVMVIAENRGLVEQTKDVARRFAKEGFFALAPDMASRIGGTKLDDPVLTMTAYRAAPEDLTADLLAGITYMKAQPFAKPGGVGVIGFCLGGGYAFEVAINSPDVKAAVPYYGTVRQLDKLGNTNAAILAIYGGNDTRTTAQNTEVEQRLKAAGKTVEIKIYDGAGHAFFNDTGGSYNAAAANDAFPKTLAWLRRYLPA